MRGLLLFLLLSLTAPCVLCQESSPPLTEEEKRQILAQLYELQQWRVEVIAYRDYVERDKEQDERERQNYERALALERKEVELTRRELELPTKERDIALDKAATYEQLYKIATDKKKGFMFVLCKIGTVGIARCR